MLTATRETIIEHPTGMRSFTNVAEGSTLTIQVSEDSEHFELFLQLLKSLKIEVEEKIKQKNGA